MKTKSVVLVVALLAALLLVVSISVPPTENGLTKGSRLTTENSNSTTIKDGANFDGTQIGRAPIAPSGVPFRDWRSFSQGMAQIAPDQLLPDPVETLGNYSQVEKRALGGSAAAALELDQLMTYCFGSASSSGAIRDGAEVLSECRTLPPAAREEPQRWLLMAARLGDIGGLTQLYGAATDLARHSANPNRSGFLAIEAIAALENAAISGEPAAYQMLTSAYYQGLFVPVDPIKAFAYADIYAKMTGEKIDQSVANKLAQSLKTADLLAVETLHAQLFASSQKAKTSASATSEPK